MLEYTQALFAQNNYILAVAIISAAACAHAIGTFLSSWLHTVVLFPGLLLGTLTSIDLGKRAGLIVGRDQDLTILIISVFGLLVSLLVHLIIADLVYWALSYNRRAHRELIERSGDRR